MVKSSSYQGLGGFNNDVAESVRRRVVECSESTMGEGVPGLDSQPQNRPGDIPVGWRNMFDDAVENGFRANGRSPCVKHLVLRLENLLSRGPTAL
jgi:hypothetical protein